MITRVQAAASPLTTLPRVLLLMHAGSPLQGYSNGYDVNGYDKYGFDREVRWFLLLRMLCLPAPPSLPARPGPDSPRPRLALSGLQGYNRHAINAFGYDKVTFPRFMAVSCHTAVPGRPPPASNSRACFSPCHRPPAACLPSPCCLPVSNASSPALASRRLHQHGFDASGYNVEGKNAAGFFRFPEASSKLVTSGSKKAKAGQ